MAAKAGRRGLEEGAMGRVAMAEARDVAVKARAVKAWEALGKVTGRDHTHLALPKQHEAIRFRDVQAQPRKIISSPIWSGPSALTTV